MSGFRTLEWGRYSGQFADFISYHIWGRSIIHCGSTTNQNIAGSFTLDTTTLSSGTTTIANYWNIITIETGNISAAIGRSAIILDAKMRFFKSGTANPDYSVATPWEALRMIDPPPTNYSGCSFRFKVNPTTWTHDAYGPSPGDDIVETPFWSDTLTIAFDGVLSDTPAMDVDITSELSYALRGAADVSFLLRPTPKISATSRGGYFFWDTEGWYPYLEIVYFNPIEFFGSNGDGTINLEDILANSADPAQNLYLGAHERGDTGSPVKIHVKNFTEQAFGLVEAWDDYPEITVPVFTGTGTGNLDYAVPTEGAVSQRYTVEMYSATEYEVKAEAYAAYTTSLHPTINGDSNWRGTTGSDFAAPSGGLAIPAIAWQATGVLNGDQFAFDITGNSTDSAWPADSNEQVQITSDNAGSPVIAGYRRIDGRRIFTAESVTVDATTKKFAVRPITSSHWVVGVSAFIGDATNLNEGSVKSAGEATIGADAFTGSGLDDINLTGNYNGVTEDNLYIEIDGTGTPDTFKWGRGASYPPSWDATTVNCVAGVVNAVELEDGIFVHWDASTGHTVTDYWAAAVNPFFVELENLTANSNVYAAGSRCGTTLPIEDLAASVFDQTDAASGFSEPQPARIYMDDPITTGFTVGGTVTITAIDGTLAETGVIDTGGVAATYIQLDANLENDYPIGAVVVQAGIGEEPVHLRPVITAITTEELKQFRINVRT